MAHSPLLFEEDEYENSADQTLSCCKPSSQLNASDQTECQEKNEQRLVERLRLLLTGVPPPPTVTVSQYDATEILRSLTSENYKNFQWTETKGNLLLKEENKAMSISSEWPLVKDHAWFNVSYNKGPFSEELALLTAKYQERYVGNETSSSCNSFFTKSPTFTASAKKRARRHAWGHSPGRRLSHLARRRHTFSSANLQQNAFKSLPDKKKMILVAKKKSETSKRGGSLTSKSSGNSKNKFGNPLNVLSSKRALFQSPENEKKNNIGNKRSVLSDKSSPSTKNVYRSKRALWPDPPLLKPEAEKDKENGHFNLNGKRTAETRFNPDTTQKKKCLRSLSFSEEQESYDKAPPVLLPENLSHLHKQKLLWAVSDALRNEGIEMEHKYFKVFMFELFKICKEVWLMKYVKEKCTGTTSDRMSQLANKFSGEVVNKVKTKLEGMKNDSSIVSECDKSNCKSNVSLSKSGKDSFKTLFGQNVCHNNELKSVGICGKVCGHVGKTINDISNESKQSEFGDESSCKSNNQLNISSDITFNVSDKFNIEFSDIAECNVKNVRNIAKEQNIDVNCKTESSNYQIKDELGEKVYRYSFDDSTLLEGVRKSKSCNVSGKYKTELYIDGFENVPVHKVSISCDNDNAVDCQENVDKREFSPGFSLNNEDTRGSSSCDIDIGAERLDV